MSQKSWASRQRRAICLELASQLSSAQRSTIDAMQMVPGHEREEYWFREGCYITEWSNSDADPHLSVARARVQPGRTTRWHRLDAITERYVILEGRGRAEVDGQARDVLPGDVVVIAPGLPQRITNTGDSDLIFLAVCTPRFEPSAYSEIAELENIEEDFRS